MKPIGFLVATLTVSAGAATSAWAQDADARWQISVAPYLWAAAYDNEVQNSANGNTSESKASFGDILDDLSFAFMGKAEVQYARFGLATDLVYLKLKSDRTTTRPVLGPVRTESEISNTVVTALGYYRVLETSGLNVDLLGGLRYVKLKLDFDVDAGGQGFSRNGSASVTKGTVGLRATQRLGAKTSLTGYGDYGGFDSDVSVWQLEGALTYQWSPKLSAFAGYRHFELNIDKGPVSSDVSFSGPVFGSTFRF